ncbi:MAG: iron ABC transporter permease, partial [Chloroflexi bacterium]|nr:iron ABC transporter permease [Chloroflexota bacterium]
MNATQTAARPRAPAFIWVPAAAIGLAMLLPPVYLGVRAADAGTGIVDILLNTRTLAILARTLVLVAVVTAACTALGVALAWLTVRTDLPLRRTFAVLTALPLVIPSYLFARLLVITLGPRGTLQGWLEPLGVDRLP